MAAALSLSETIKIVIQQSISMICTKQKITRKQPKVEFQTISKSLFGPWLRNTVVVDEPH